MRSLLHSLALAPFAASGLLLLVLALGWIGADAFDAFRRWRARHGTGKSTVIGDNDGPAPEFPSRHVRRRAAKEMTRRLFGQASAHGRTGIKPHGVLD